MYMVSEQVTPMYIGIPKKKYRVTWSKMYGVTWLDAVQNYPAGSHVFDHMTLIFLHKPINYGVAYLLYSAACLDTVM